MDTLHSYIYINAVKREPMSFNTYMYIICLVSTRYLVELTDDVFVTILAHPLKAKYIRRKCIYFVYTYRGRVDEIKLLMT